MDQTPHKDHLQEQNGQNEPTRLKEERLNLAMDSATDTGASGAGASLNDPEKLPASAGSGGRGEVSSDHNRRLHDNLTPQQRSEIGRKGGQRVSQNREHMAAIGREGGRA